MSMNAIVYSAAKLGGGFALASRWTAGELRILCYHGFSFRDEHEFRPQLFQTPELFESRMKWLKREGYRALSLDAGMRRLREGTLERGDMVITIDDGFYSVAALAAPILSGVGYTATVYATTYYVVRNNPVFRLAVQYLFWKTSRDSVSCGDLVPGLERPGATKGSDGERTAGSVIEHGETRLDEAGRVALAHALAQRLEVDFDELVASRRLTLMSGSEIADLARRGFDVQLHTHRHNLPENAGAAKREIEDNRAVLAPLTGRPLNHLCYPSGVWARGHWPLLEGEGIDTATTCDPGLNSRATPPLALKRFLDTQSMPRIVFEAEVSGFAHLLRRALRRTNG